MTMTRAVVLLAVGVAVLAPQPAVAHPSRQPGGHGTVPAGLPAKPDVVTLDPHVRDTLRALDALYRRGYRWTSDAGAAKAIRSWQQVNGLTVDGIVGPETLGSLDLDTSWAGLTRAGMTRRQPSGPSRQPAPTATAAATPTVPAWHDQAIAAGWTESLWPFVDCVIARESHGDPSAHGVGPRDDSRGLLQLNTIGSLWSWYRAHGLTDRSQLYDPATNLAFGWELYQIPGLHPWGTCP